jgi:ubiquinone/menaquinone biosynthesis C-methylase UbiE
MELATRVMEPELMEDVDQARAYAAADHSESHNAFVQRFADRFPKFKGGAVLDLGCGTADVIIRFACRYPDTEVTGIDGSEAMLAVGREAVLEAGLVQQISLEYSLLPDSSLAPGYDAIICNSLLHQLHKPQVLWDTVRDTAGDGCAVFVMDLRRPEDTQSVQGMVDRYAPNEPEVFRKDFYNSLCAAFTPEEVKGQLSAAGLAKLLVEATGDRHLLVYGSL